MCEDAFYCFLYEPLFAFIFPTWGDIGIYIFEYELIFVFMRHIIFIFQNMGYNVNMRYFDIFIRHICAIKIWKYNKSNISIFSYFHIFIAQIWRIKIWKYAIFWHFYPPYLRDKNMEIWNYRYLWNVYMAQMSRIQIWK